MPGIHAIPCSADAKDGASALTRACRARSCAVPERLRAVFFLRHVDGSSTEETAKALGLSTVAVRARLHRARATLRETMSDYALD